LPDTCILFRRYVESGKMINIYDWYDSFAMALEGETDNDGDSMDVDETPTKSKGKGKEKAPPKGKRTEHEAERKREVQARFMRSMHELEFVGFLKHTGRKADHVVKTVFDVLD
jgi:origin recognition complex subunit 3